jgi:hypothetical protein
MADNLELKLERFAQLINSLSAANTHSWRSPIVNLKAGTPKPLTKVNIEDHFRVNPFLPMTWSSPVC